MKKPNEQAMRCRPAFEMICVHANGDVVCSIMDGRGDFVLGNVYKETLAEIFAGERCRQMRELVLSTSDTFCRTIGKNCCLKTVPAAVGEEAEAVTLKYLAIEPTTACNLRCLVCPTRDFSSALSWRDAYRDGGLPFFAWDIPRRLKQHAVDFLRSAFPNLPEARSLGLTGSLLLRGRIPAGRSATMPIDLLRRVIDEAGADIQRVDMFSYGEPFLYKHLVEALRHIRLRLPRAPIAMSTNGAPVLEDVEDRIIQEELADCIAFSIDGSDRKSYDGYRIGGDFEKVFANMIRFHRKARGSSVHIVWQYIVFRWNDSDEQLQQAIRLAKEEGLTLWFNITQTWGRSKRPASELRYLDPYLNPFYAWMSDRPAECSPEEPPGAPIPLAK